jgi:hypothetical protein
MPDTKSDPESEKPIHRGRIQAQGGGTEESESWARATPPTLSDVIGLIDRLEARLTPKERRIREKGFAQLRRVVEQAAKAGGIWARSIRSFPQPPLGDIRVDLEVITGRACVPDVNQTAGEGDER